MDTFKNSILDYNIDEIIAKIEPTMYSKINETINLDIKKLILPNPRRNRIPRPQNKFLIYRRAFQIKYSLKYGLVDYENLGSISKLASKQWKYEDVETRNIYECLSKLANHVHKILYPNYNYKPRKKQTNPLHIETTNIINNLSSQFKPVPREMNYLLPINQFKPVPREMNYLPPINQFKPVPREMNYLSPINQFKPVPREMNYLPPINQLLSDSNKIQPINDYSTRNKFHLPPIRILPPIAQLTSIRREMNNMLSISQLISQPDNQ